MRYRKLGKTGLEVSVLGFGAMRLPLLGGGGGADIFDPSKSIDEIEAARMVEYAIEQGINYFDTAYGYHSGKSETFLGKILKKHRSNVMIATKLPTWLVEKQESFDKLFNEQLAKLSTAYLDFYLIHGLNRASWIRMKEMGALKFLDRLLSDGKIRFAGFSFHDDLQAFREIVDGYGWSICQIQYNFYDETYQAGNEGLAYAASRGLGVVVMEPLRGGKLAEKIPHEIQSLWDTAGTKRSPASWAMRWVWNHGEVSTALTGASSLVQLMENTRVADEASVDSLSSDDLSLIERVKAAYRRMLKVDCTNCMYCMPCPNGVNIPQNFSLYNDTYLFKDPDLSVMLYNRMMTPEQRASNCNDCHVCEELCPQKIQIPDALKDVHKRLAGK